MSTMDPIGQQLPEEVDGGRMSRTVAFLSQNRPVIERWFWKSLIAFNLLLGSLVFWTVVVPSLL